MTNSDQKTGKPVVAKPAKAVSAPKPVAKAAAAKAPAIKTPASAAKAPSTVAKAPSTVAKAPSTVAKAPTPIAKPAPVPTPTVAAKPPAPVAKVAAPKIATPVAVKPAAQAPAPVAQAPAPEAAAPTPVAPKSAAQTLMDISLAPIAPAVKAAIAVGAGTPVSKPVEAPVSSSIAAKASTIPPIPQIMVSAMSTQTFKGYEDFAAFGKANLEAFVQANKLFTSGIESLSKEVVSLAQSSLESSTAATKAMFAAKTLKDVVELQADFAKTSFEKMVANSTKLGEMTVKLATDSAAPIGARVTAASEKAMKKA
ncbi:MAG: hypothetical protein JWO51_3014 [Rhodospirillales bacterium]|nr:hypothetical protein [Rhodospirillales bacterium]